MNFNLCSYKLDSSEVERDAVKVENRYINLYFYHDCICLSDVDRNKFVVLIMDCLTPPMLF
jgi:hypothetical protein